MPLIGPVRPRRYFASPSAGPEPTESGFAVGEIITCPGTGRMWICNSGVSGDLKQILPYVRTDDGLTAVQGVNSTGNLLFQRPGGATGGEVNFFNNVVIGPNSIKFGNLTETSTNAGPLLCKPRNVATTDGEVFVADQMARFNLLNDVALGTSWSVVGGSCTAAISDLTFSAPAVAAYAIPYRFNLAATFYHNNQFNVHVGLVQFTSATFYTTLVSTTVHSHQGGYVQANLECLAYLEYFPAISYSQKIEVVAWTDVSGVVMKKIPVAAFPEFQPVLSTNAASYLNVERKG